MAYVMDQSDTGRKIRHFRKKTGLGLRDLAKLAELSPAAISAIERGKNSPTLATMHKILKALNTDFAEFFASPQQMEHEFVFPAEEMASLFDKNRKCTLVFPKREDILFEMSLETINTTKNGNENN